MTKGGIQMKKEKKINIKIEGVEIEEILEREIKKTGNSSHAILPKRHTGKKAVIVIQRRNKK